MPRAPIIRSCILAGSLLALSVCTVTACSGKVDDEPAGLPASGGSGGVGAGGEDGGSGGVDLFGGGGTAGSTTSTTSDGGAGGEAPLPAPDFLLPDVNETSATYNTNVSPRDYLGQVSAWYFGSAL